MELYDSQYLLILAPSLVIVIMFLFFWLFMKETSYDEVLARQKRDHKPQPVRPESRKKNEKKKSKKKESGGGVLGDVANGQESDSEHRDLDLNDGVPEEEDQASSIVIAPASNEAPAGLRDRKRRDRKQQQQSRAGQDESAREVNGSKPAPKKEMIPLSKQPTPPSDAASGKKKSTQKKQKIEADDFLTETKPESVCVPTRKEVPLLPLDAKLLESSAAKKKAPKKQKPAEPGLGDEPLTQAPVYIPPMDSDPATAVPEKKSVDTATKTNAKKLKNETDKENSEVKFKEYLSILKSLTREETVNVAAVLIERNPAVLDSWQRQSGKADATVQQLQERERLLSTIQEEASIAKEKVKQLSQELLVEKQKGSLAESLLREQLGAMEKELSVLQGKAQGNYQENQAVQIKFQQLEGQIARLQQENGILRDAVSSATNQMESKQSSELNKLRSDYGRVMAELAEKSSKLQQEDALRKNVEVTYKQTVSQLEDLLNKNISLTDHIETLQAQMASQVQPWQTFTPTVSQVVLLAEKEAQRNALEECLKVERSSWASREAQLQALELQSESLKEEVEAARHREAEQVSTRSQFQELQILLQAKGEQVQALERAAEERGREAADREQQLQVLREESSLLRVQLLEEQQRVQEQQVLREESSSLRVQLLEEQQRVQEQQNQVQMAAPSQELLSSLMEKEKQVAELQSELGALREAVELHRKKNNELREKNWSAMEALSATESVLQGKLNKTAKEGQKALASMEMQTREALHRLFPSLPLPHRQNHQEWLQEFETAAKEALASKPEDSKLLKEKLRESEELHRIMQKDCETYKKVLAETLLKEKLRESEELHRIMQKDCETYKKVLAETVRAAFKYGFRRYKVVQTAEGILQRLQSSVEQEESRWRVKLEVSQSELRQARAVHWMCLLWILLVLLPSCQDPLLQQDAYPECGSCPQEGILQRLQSSVEQEESRWRVKLEVSQSELRQMHLKVTGLEKEVERLCADSRELEILRQERQHLEFQLEKAEKESATYVSEVRELKDLLTELQSKLDGSYSEAVRQNEELNLLKTQLKETLSKLEAEERERHKVAGDLHKAQQGLDLIRAEILKETGQASLIENSTLATEREETDRKMMMAAGLNQTVMELQQLLQSVKQQLSKGHEGSPQYQPPLTLAFRNVLPPVLQTRLSFLAMMLRDQRKVGPPPAQHIPAAHSHAALESADPCEAGCSDSETRLRDTQTCLTEASDRFFEDFRAFFY
ncbi:UNVERIFIED_CONTAM: hypothetical protein FKN15_010417 [Acipenser sinensis]